MNILKINLCLSLIFCCISLFAQTGFGPEQVITDNEHFGTDKSSCVIGSDLDNDGDDDIIVAGVNRIIWYKNNGNGQFDLHRVINDSMLLNSGIHIVSKDLDGDGNQDIVSTAGNAIGWYENDGNGNFSDFLIISDQVITATSVFATDIDNDGDNDVISSSFNDNKFAWYENDGDGNFGDQIIISGSATRAKSVHCADMDNDGDMDMVGAFSNSLAWYENDGDGNFWTGNSVSYFYNISYVEAVDLDNDGNLDILGLARYYNRDKISSFKNDGNGNFADEQIIHSFDELAPYGQPTGTSSFLTADIDQDGDKDISVFSTKNKKLMWFENDGSGNFPTENTVDYYKFTIDFVFPSDLDNDGDMDILSSSGFTNTVDWYENENGIFDSKETLTLDAEEARCVIAADLDNDGDLDAVSASHKDGKIAWYENDGVANFGVQSVIDNRLFRADKVIAEDLDGDGDLDLIAEGLNPLSNIVWYENDGMANFDAPKLVSDNDTFTVILDIHTGDIDNDGDMDIGYSYSIDNDSSGAGWYENDGSGNFTDHIINTSFSTIHRNIHLADFDGDNSLDLLVDVYGDYYGGLLIRNDGAGNFSVPDSIEYSLFHNNVMDVDNDNDLDIIAEINFSTGVLINDGTGHFLAQNLPTIHSPYNINSIRDGDMDNDGDPDLIISSNGYSGDTLVWHENLGSGVFGPQQIILVREMFDVSYMGTNSIFPADLDNDGDLDFLKAIAKVDNISFHLNLLNNPAVSGNIYWDFNGNGLFDADDIPINGQVNVSPDAITEINSSPSSYHLYLENGEHTITVNPIAHWTPNPDTSYVVNMADSTHLTGYNFGFIPLDTTAATISNISSQQIACSQFTYFYFNWLNTSTTILDGYAEVNIDNWVDSILFLDNVPDSVINSNQFIWEFSNLLPGQSVQKTIRLRIPGVADGLVLGDTIHLQMDVHSESVSPVIGLAHQSSATYDPVILCSYDPNDKLVSPERGGENLTLFGEPLVYTIRFQNTGNYFATDIVLRDTLDPNLDPSTLRIMSSSHPAFLQTSLEQGRYLIFSFEDIMLTYSDDDFEASQGYVTYVVEPFPGLPVETEINNTASIYFDVNPPIVTNTTSNQLTDEIINGYTLLEACDSLVYGGQAYFDDASLGDTTCIYNGCIIDNFVRIVIHPSFLEQEDIIINSGENHTLPDGNIVDAAGVYTSTLQSIYECDSIIITNLDVATGVHSIQQNDLEFSISPNPASSDFSIRMDSNTDLLQIEIYNVLSEKVYSNDIVSTLDVNVGNWADGIYFVFIRNGDEQVLGSRKLVKIE